ncbi:SDR family oxidoreductase [Rufibacter soli]
MATKTISVMGCGWLGLPLAEKLVNMGYQVKGSTTTTPSKIAVLQEKGIQPFLLSFPENMLQTDLQEFLTADVLVFNLPPSKSSSGANTYEELLTTVLEARPATLQAIVFVSSTSVYPDLNREVYEKDAVASPEASSLMLRCEYRVQHSPEVSSTIIRFGGLMGGSRHPGRFLAGKTEVPNPTGPVNMIHLTDCVNLLSDIIRLEKWGYIFNASAPKHPSREEFYTMAAHQAGLVPPVFSHQGESSFKIINSDLLQKELNFSFQFPDPIQCLASPEF